MRVGGRAAWSNMACGRWYSIERASPASLRRERPLPKTERTVRAFNPVGTPETLAERLVAIEEHADKITFCEANGMQLLEPLIHGWGRSAAVFLDPPYTAGGKRAGARLYAHNDIDHAGLFETIARRSSNFLMTYDCAPEIVDLVRRHRFHAVSVQMKNAHHNHLSELVITREPLFS